MARRSDAEVQEIQRLYQDRIASVLQGEVLPNEIEFSNEQQPGWQPLSSAQLLVLIHKLSTCSNVRKFSLEGTHYCNTICFESGMIFSGPFCFRGGQCACFVCVWFHPGPFGVAFACDLIVFLRFPGCHFGNGGAIAFASSLRGHLDLQHVKLNCNLFSCRF